uniref:VWFD domain-containing protein n=1 Tax=Knipowitschia caucasica TaxID=637954 RepID=A0AAV2JSK3_KNICA
MGRKQLLQQNLRRHQNNPLQPPSLQPGPLKTRQQKDLNQPLNSQHHPKDHNRQQQVTLRQPMCLLQRLKFQQQLSELQKQPKRLFHRIRPLTLPQKPLRLTLQLHLKQQQLRRFLHKLPIQLRRVRPTVTIALVSLHAHLPALTCMAHLAAVKCGCMDDSGKKYDFGDVWYSRHCMEKCKCEKRRGVGKISCEEQEECSRDAVCLQNNNGEYVCEKTDFSDCTINKDPEYRTFDDRKHGFEGEHSYVLVQTNHLPNTLQSIYIEGINGYSEDHEDSSEERRRHDDDDDDSDEDSKEDSDEDSDEDKESVLRALKIRVYNHTVVFKPSRRVVVDGNRVDTPVSPSSGLKIQKRRYRLYLQTDFGLSVEFDGKGKAEIMLPHVYKHKVGGLCGNFDGHRHNDFMKPDGTQTRSVQEFGESWRV